MKQVPLMGKNGEGKFALIDDDDLKLVAPYKWYLRSGYASTTYHKKGCGKDDAERNINVTMHRLIMGFPNRQVDHEDRDRLNNQKYNLRPATHAQNCQNTVKSVVNKTGYRGVKQESTNVFRASVSTRTIGYYDTALKAAQARDIEALKEQGKFAILNFKKEDLPEHVESLPARNTGERTSTVVGVSYAKNRQAKQKWRVVLRKKHIGWFETEEQAVLKLAEMKNESQVSA